MKVKGFALVEVPMMAALEGDKVGHGGAESLAGGRAALLGALQQLSEYGKIGPITRPGTPDMPWPTNAFIRNVMPIQRLYGLSATRVFHVFVELEAPGFPELIQAFEYLDHFCGVEGYGGGG